MNRRNFLLSSLSVASLTALRPSQVLALGFEDQILSTSRMITDNDEYPLETGGRPDMSYILGQMTVSRNLKYWTFNEVIDQLSPFIESKFEMFFIANTASKGARNEFVPYQNMKVLRKIDISKPLFSRDENNSVIGLTENAEIWADVPISSGKGSPKILTYSGIFRVNHNRTKARVGTNESPSAFMSWSTYIDFIYENGVEAAVALHGTPQKNHHLLGKSRASEGCLRCLPETAKNVRELLLSPAMWSDSLPAFDQYRQLPSLDLKAGNVDTRPGIKALFIFFNGYSDSIADA